MGIRQKEYAKKLEAELAGGKSLEKAHEAAVKRGGAKPKVKKPKKAKPYDEEALTKKVARMLKMIYHGKKYHKKTQSRKK